MAVNGNFPKHLTVAARTGVLISPVIDNMPYRRVATEFDLTQKTTTLVDLGGDPIVTEDPKAVDTMVEFSKTATPKDWYVSVGINGNDLDDDQTGGGLMRRFMGIMPAFQRHINERVFTVLNAGDGATYGTGISSEANFFDTAHLYPGGKNTTTQSNLNTLALSLTNFDTAWVAMRQFKNDQGSYLNLNPNLLICAVALNKTAAQIADNREDSTTTDRATNPYAGTVRYFTVPEFDSTAWVIIDESRTVKPLYVGIRKRPTLLEEKFDGEQPNGGLYTWRYHARYVVGYGDPMLAYMGKT